MHKGEFINEEADIYKVELSLAETLCIRKSLFGEEEAVDKVELNLTEAGWT